MLCREATGNCAFILHQRHWIVPQSRWTSRRATVETTPENHTNGSSQYRTNTLDRIAGDAEPTKASGRLDVYTQDKQENDSATCLAAWTAHAPHGERLVGQSVKLQVCLRLSTRNGHPQTYAASAGHATELHDRNELDHIQCARNLEHGCTILQFVPR